MKTLMGIPVPPVEEYSGDEPTETNLAKPPTPDQESKALFDALCEWRALLIKKYGVARTHILATVHRAVVVDFRQTLRRVS